MLDNSFNTHIIGTFKDLIISDGFPMCLGWTAPLMESYKALHVMNRYSLCFTSTE